MEATLGQVKYDKVRLETENRRLEEHFNAQRKPQTLEKQTSMPTVKSGYTDKPSVLLSGRD